MRRIVTALGALPIVGLLALAGPAAAHAANGTPVINSQQYANPRPVQPAAAQVRQELPSYTCDRVQLTMGRVTARGNCTTADNLPEYGTIKVPFIIRARTGQTSAVSCSVQPFVGAGEAQLPEAVSAYSCRVIS